MHIENIADLIRALDQQVDESVKNEIRAFEKSDLWQMHLGINGLIRGIAYYSNESTIGRQHFDRLGFPDDGSAVLGRIYWLHLKSIDVTKEAVVALIEQHALFVFDAEASDLADEMTKSYADVNG